MKSGWWPESVHTQWPPQSCQQLFKFLWLEPDLNSTPTSNYEVNSQPGWQGLNTTFQIWSQIWLCSDTLSTYTMTDYMYSIQVSSWSKKEILK
jgi:hypothetical protein